MNLSGIGIIADVMWYEIKNHAKNVELDAFVVMPNHIHGIIIINKPHQSFGVSNCMAITFHDHIIRNENEFKRIRNYIINNPKNWTDDKFNK